jgi:multicomponent Na+:H+ antiporter subunit D
MSSLLSLSVLVPLAGGAAAFVGGPRAAGPLGALTTVATAFIAALLVAAVWEDGTVVEQLGAWPVPLGIELQADGISAAMVLLSATVAVPVGIYALRYFREGSERALFWPLWLILWASLNALFVSRDVFNLYVALELLTLAAVGLVILPGRRAATSAGTRYLLAAMLGSLGYLLGVALLYGAHGTVDIGLLGAQVGPGAASSAALALMLAGLGLKAALFPLHFWLPPAHSSAPSPVSAVLSGLVVTAAFYLSFRLGAEVFPLVLTLPAAQVIGALGAGAILIGSVQAIRAGRLKLLVAYSTVAQVGYLFLAIALAVAAGDTFWDRAAWTGGIFYAAAHGCAKAAMFLAAGCVLFSVGHDRIRGLAGTASRLPLPIFTFALAGVTLMGLPPSGGFTGKFLMLNAAVEAGQWWWVAVIVVGGLLAAGYVFPVLRTAFEEPGPGQEREFRPAPAVMQGAGLALALVAIGMGLASAPLLELIQSGTEGTVLAGSGP